eukprot:TRINITY_DN92432_c0_g1_i1.p1 TRINITY_DN92432_c0_g1~~TRINITY_DN92432_c0_g1_i1.p1  ORF type:complete len:477 (-),score=32.11 TRINITY_DN92432_c0_g1_i1:590-2020(-)
MSYDAIVIGAGSGGSHAASSLANGGWKVLLLEAGSSVPQLPRDAWNGEKKRFSFRSRHTWWKWPGVPFVFLSGRALGGTSAFNGMIHTRGRLEDFPLPAADVHEALDAVGLTTLEPPAKVDQLPAVVRAFLPAFASAQLPWRGMHGLSPSEAGLGFIAEWPSRLSAYEDALVRRRNLTTSHRKKRGRLDVLRHVVARRLVWDATSYPPLVRGVSVRYPDNSTWTFPGRHVVMAAGTFGTASVLLASDARNKCNDNIGRHLSEHFGFDAMISLNAPCDPLATEDPVLSAEAARILSRSNMVAFLHGLSVEVPMKFTCCYNKSGEMVLCVGLTFMLLKGTSRGTIRLREGAALADFTVTTDDLVTLADAFKYVTRHVFASPTLADYSPEVIVPRDGGLEWQKLIDHITRTIRNYGHPTGTTSRALGERLKLRGCQGIRIADASAFPASVTGHPDVPTRALGRLAAKYMLEDQLDSVPR